ncbi:MAG: hypothetical protein K6U11_07600 [bacterium]|nr:hypothetical protein [bacterium]
MADKRVPEAVFLLVILYFVIFVCLTWSPRSARAADQENCMLCHRYSGLGCFDKETGAKRIFYVSEGLYRNSVHNNVLCSHCHTDVTEVPHKPAKKVNCATQCHVKDPSTNKDFSHKIVVDEFKKSVHGKSPLFTFEEGQPRCKYCHTNPLYSPLRGILAQKPGCESEALARCVACHEKSPWASRFLKHFVSRTAPRWNKKQIVDLCNNCHADKKLMQNFGLESTENFKQTFHWRNVKYEAENGADCLSCHGPRKLGFSAHTILPVDDPTSPLYAENRVKTCGQSGCHQGATKLFASGAVHGTGVKAALLEKKLRAEGEEISPEEKKKLRTEIDDAGMTKLQQTIIWGIKTFYKVMIVLVGGFMFIHQLLDLRITLKERREGRHH